MIVVGGIAEKFVYFEDETIVKDKFRQSTLFFHFNNDSMTSTSNLDVKLVVNPLLGI